jgi:hypothetical protein
MENALIIMLVALVALFALLAAASYRKGFRDGLMIGSEKTGNIARETVREVMDKPEPEEEIPGSPAWIQNLNILANNIDAYCDGNLDAQRDYVPEKGGSSL